MSPLHRLAPSLAAALLFPAVGAAADRIECTVEVKLHRLVGQGVFAFPREPDLPPERRGLAEVEVSVLSTAPKVPEREADRARCAQLSGLRTLLKVGWKDPERTVRFDPEAPLKLDYIWWDPGVSSPFEVWELPPEPGTWIPPYLDAITDLAKVLTPEQAKDLKTDLQAASDARLWVLTVPSLSGEGIESFSQRVANAWSEGEGGRGWEILVTLAVAERKARIEVGKELAERIPDERAQAILDEEMGPAFREGDYAGGLGRGVRALQAAANPGSSFLECEVRAKVLKLEKKAAVDAQIAQTLDLPETAIGALGVAKVEIDVLDAKVRRGQKESCDAMVGKTGTIVVRYPLARQDVQLAAGEVLDLDYFGYAGFAPYGVPGRESWTLREP